jgi:adenosylhomocysteine nucleosidase
LFRAVQPGVHVTPVGIFVATRWERQALLRVGRDTERRIVAGISCNVVHHAELEWCIVPMGVGPERAAAAAKAVCAQQAFSLMVSAGFACALNHAQIGDVLIGTEVVIGTNGGISGKASCDMKVVEGAALAAQSAGLPMHIGRFVSVPTVLCRAVEKQAVARQEKGIGLDMESAAIGAVAREQRIPFAIIRTVSDLVEEDLPLDFNLFLRPSGWMAGVISCLTHPASLTGLNRLRRQSNQAAERLTAVYGAWAALSGGAA